MGAEKRLLLRQSVGWWSGFWGGLGMVMDLPFGMRLLILISGLLLVPLGPPLVAQSDQGFQFVRVRYDANRYARWHGMWATDYPEAEFNLHTAIEQTTDIKLDGPPLVFTLLEEEIFEYPVLYLTEPGYWQTNDEEVANMRRYLERGGFMIIDDFHEWQWDNMYQNMKQVFPDKEPVRLEPDHPIWSVYFEIDPVAAASTKPQFGPDEDEYYAIYGDDGRILVVICYNQDIGDGWEWPNRNRYDEASVSFQMAINFIVWALSH